MAKLPLPLSQSPMTNMVPSDPAILAATQELNDFLFQYPQPVDCLDDNDVQNHHCNEHQQSSSLTAMFTFQTEVLHTINVLLGELNGKVVLLLAADPCYEKSPIPSLLYTLLLPLCPSTPCNAHSNHSEGYELLAALTFLEKYIIATAPTMPIKLIPIQGFCNNAGLIQQVQTLQDNQIPNPLLSLTNNHDLINEIYQTIK